VNKLSLEELANRHGIGSPIHVDEILQWPLTILLARRRNLVPTEAWIIATARL
jgi:hypothetical protein